MQEKYPQAIEALTQFSQARPEVPGTYFFLGMAYDKLRNVKNAMLNYQKFLNVDHGKTDRQDFQARERIKVLEKRSKKR
jgi:tetratricopeptide (TPR) repeat protein